MDDDVAALRAEVAALRTQVTNLSAALLSALTRPPTVTWGCTCGIPNTLCPAHWRPAPQPWQPWTNICGAQLAAIPPGAFAPAF